jgi:hypothetical protein
VTIKTALEIRRTSNHKINNWQRQCRVMAQITNKYGGHEASKHQDIIGWKNFMIGRMVPEWVAVQQCYYEWLRR